VDQISGTTPVGAPAPSQDPPQAQQQGQSGAAIASVEPPGFRSRGSARRRGRFLRKARELAYRDLGGLVFNLHRFGQRNDALVLAKLTTLGHIDGELRALEGALHERRPVTVLREAGITACARCAAIHSSEDRFCPNCGLSMGRHLDLPVAAAPAPADAIVASPQPSTAQPPVMASTRSYPVSAAVAQPVPPVGSPPASPSPPAPPPAAAPAAADAAAADDAPASAAVGTSSAPEEATEILRPGESGGR
jgi:hypothetical protein